MSSAILQVRGISPIGISPFFTSLLKGIRKEWSWIGQHSNKSAQQSEKGKDFANLIDTLTPKQINFLMAVADGVTNFSSKEVLTKYQLGTSANIKNLKKVTTEKDLIDILLGNKIELQDPVFEYWLKHIYR